MDKKEEKDLSRGNKAPFVYYDEIPVPEPTPVPVEYEAIMNSPVPIKLFLALHMIGGKSHE